MYLPQTLVYGVMMEKCCTVHLQRPAHVFWVTARPSHGSLVKVSLGTYENRVEQSGRGETLGNGLSCQVCRANGMENLLSHTTVRYHIVEI